MTLISQFKYKNTDAIFMFADGLISSDAPEEGNFIMPGVGRVGRPQTIHKLYLHSMEQKLNVLGKDLAYSYAGSYDLGARFGNDLHTLYTDPEFNFEKLVEFCDSWSEALTDEEKHEVALLCTYHDDDEYRTWNYEMKNADGYKHYSLLRIEGSGIKNFQKVVDEDSNVIENDDHAFGHAMNLVNKFYHDDLFVQSNYNQSFGGFYELATCSQEGIEKVTDIFVSTIHIDARRLADGFAIPITFLKQDHIDNVTVLRDLKKVNESLPDGTDMRASGHIYLPTIDAFKEKAVETAQKILSEGQFYNSELIGDLKAKHTLIMLELVDETHVLKIPLYYRRANRNTPMAVTNVDGEISIFLETELLQTIERNIDTHIDRENKCLRDA